MKDKKKCLSCKLIKKKEENFRRWVNGYITICNDCYDARKSDYQPKKYTKKTNIVAGLLFDMRPEQHVSKSKIPKNGVKVDVYDPRLDLTIKRMSSGKVNEFGDLLCYHGGYDYGELVAWKKWGSK